MSDTEVPNPNDAEQLADLLRVDAALANPFLGEASDYRGRPGYQPGFLGDGLTVPLPKLSKRLAGDVFDPPHGGRWIRYWSYSVLMSRSRKLPIVSAANFDQSTKDRDAVRSRDWFFDPRLGASQEAAKNHQVGDEWYLAQPVLTLLERTSLFDRGHMTAFEHAIFGDDAQTFGLDTFHFTNCAPQAKDFNETGIWRQIEKWTATNGTDRLCFFNGPVFNAPVSTTRSDGEYALHPRGRRTPDPDFNGLSIPKQFFKIAVYNVGGQLTVQSFVVTQEKYLQHLEFGVEAVTPVQLEIYRLPLADVEHLTGLDFSDLAGAAGSVNDVAAPEPELITTEAQVRMD